MDILVVSNIKVHLDGMACMQAWFPAELLSLRPFFHFFYFWLHLKMQGTWNKIKNFQASTNLQIKVNIQKYNPVLYANASTHGVMHLPEDIELGVVMFCYVINL